MQRLSGQKDKPIKFNFNCTCTRFVLVNCPLCNLMTAVTIVKYKLYLEIRCLTDIYFVFVDLKSKSVS